MSKNRPSSNSKYVATDRLMYCHKCGMEHVVHTRQRVSYNDIYDQINLKCHRCGCQTHTFPFPKEEAS